MSILKNIFTVVPKVFSIIMMVISGIEFIHEVVEEGSSDSQEKHKEAVEKINEILQDAIDDGFLPEWADIFLDKKLVDWLIGVLVKVAHKRGFFEKMEG